MTTEPAAEGLGLLERKHLQYASFRAVAGGAEVTRTHWHIAVANGLGWGFDGMDSMVFSLVARWSSRNSRSTCRAIARGCRSRCSSALPDCTSGRSSPTLWAA